MQLTEELTHVARACQDKYDRMGEELGFNVLFYRLGYAWVLYEAEEVERMRPIVEMHHRIGVHSRFLSAGRDSAAPALSFAVATRSRGRSSTTMRSSITMPSCGRTSSTWHEHPSGSSRTRPSNPSSEDAHGVEAVVTDRGRIATRVVLNAAGGWSTDLNRLAAVSAPNRPLRREVLVTAPVRRSIEAAITFYRPTEGWFNQTLRGEIVMGVVDPDERKGVNQRSSWDFLRRTATLMTQKAPALADVSVIRQWAGMYDVSPDHQPLVGPTSQLDGWWQANGWSGRGMLLGPYLTELLGERFVTGVDTGTPEEVRPRPIRPGHRRRRT